MRLLRVNVTYAILPQATPSRCPSGKGKIERPYRWLQDRIVRTYALKKLNSLNEVRSVLRDELDSYNNHQAHSTTGEIPSLRFENARKNGNSFFRLFSLPKPYTSPKDVFCLHGSRIVNGYRRIALFNQDIEVPHVPVREDVEFHLIPDLVRQAPEVRIWFEHKMVHSLSIALADSRVHF
jgi:hypothetical protein